jgi:hypothetical protein
MDDEIYTREEKKEKMITLTCYRSIFSSLQQVKSECLYRELKNREKLTKEEKEIFKDLEGHINYLKELDEKIMGLRKELEVV